MKKSHIVVLLVVGVLLLDQLLKFWVKTNMTLGQEIYPLGANNGWFRLHFTENKGMAFGLELGGNYGKLLLSVFRIIAVGFMVYYIRLLIRHRMSAGLVYSIASIMAGAIGNILDSAFYGLIFSESTPYAPAVLFPSEGGYAGFLYGKVVDMFYFPLYSGMLPDWLPFFGGRYVIFFRPVFNLADTAISVGVFAIILFQRSFFKEPSVGEGEQPATALSSPDAPVSPETDAHS